MTSQTSLSAIAWVMSPINVLQCIIAHKHLQTELGLKINLKLFYHYPTLDNGLAEEIYSVVKDIAKSADESVECILVTYNQADDQSYISSISSISSIAISPDYLFYAHDVVGVLLDTLISLYGSAKLVCYGDALGQFFKREVHLGYLSQDRFLTKAKQYLRSFLGKEGQGPYKKTPDPEYAVLSIPVSQSKFPRKTKLFVPPRQLVHDVFLKCVENNKAVQLCCLDLIAEIDKHSGRPVYLFPIENMTEGNFISVDNEVILYERAIDAYCKEGALILIKPHPGEKFDKVRLLQEKVGNRYTIIKIDKAYKRYPIELFLPLIQRCKVLCMFYPVLSLKYLYDVDVNQPLSDQMIEKHFEKRYWNSYKNAIGLNVIPLGRLSRWDGESLLYNGR